MISLLAEIPAPSTNSIGFVRIYGITMALAMAVGVVIAHRRYSRTHDGSMAILDMFLPTIIAGIIGSRVYHLFTGYNWDSEGISGIYKLRNGGLSIWGAVFAAALALFIQARMKKISFVELSDAIVPALLVAQAIGRVGNYFNQELYGRPLNAPWALNVDMFYRPLGLESISTYHPTFLYEALWCLGLAGIIIICEKKAGSWRPGQSSALYVAGYCAGRCVFEYLRVDKATELLGIRFNLLLSAVLCLVGVIWFVYLLRTKHKVHTEPVGQ